MKKNEFYIMGFVTDHTDKSWEFGGLFEAEDLAVDSCYSDDCFIARVILNEFLSKETVQFKYSYYPRLEEKPKDEHTDS